MQLEHQRNHWCTPGRSIIMRLVCSVLVLVGASVVVVQDTSVRGAPGCARSARLIAGSTAFVLSVPLVGPSPVTSGACLPSLTHGCLGTGLGSPDAFCVDVDRRLETPGGKEKPMAEPRDSIEYLDLAAAALQQDKERTYTAMHLQSGQAVLDVGCGPGIDTLALASLVGPTGQVVGVDHDAAMIAEAKKRAAQAGCSTWCHHYQADAEALPQPSNTFDACRSERLFQHVPNPAAVLAGMARVTKPGGWVVVLDADWSTLSIATPETDLERRLARYRLEHDITSGYVGRQLYGLFNAQQFTEIVVEPRPIFLTDYTVGRYATQLDLVESGALAEGLISEEELKRWRQSLEQAQARGAFFLHLLAVLVAGRRAEPTSR